MDVGCVRVLCSSGQTLPYVGRRLCCPVYQLVFFHAVDRDVVSQVEKTNELSAAANGKASVVESQAQAVATQAKHAAQASQQQLAALEKAKTTAAAAAAAGEKAKASLRYGSGRYTAWLLCMLHMQDTVAGYQ